MTLFEDDLFIALDTKSSTEPTRLHFRILDCSVGTTARQVVDFYVDCGEDCRLQDIYYNANHGLFIATNDLDYSTCKNCILRVDLTYLNKRRVAGDAINGEELPVASRWNVNLSTTIYTQCNIESFFISNSGELLVCCNVGKFAINGRKSYCYVTDTGTNEETYLMHTDDYRNEAFTVETTKLTDRGHCNGAAYYKNTLYSCDYIRSDKKEIGIFELSNAFSEIKEKTQEVSTAQNTLYGALTYYKDGKFLLVNYNPSSTYGISIKVDLGLFNKDAAGSYSYYCEETNYVTVDNTLIDETYDRGVLQDAHYEPGIGLFIGGYVSKLAPTSSNSDRREALHYIMRIDIDNYLNSDVN